MARRRNEDATVELDCPDDLEHTPWDVEGRFNAEGEFEPFDGDDMFCSECTNVGEPTDSEVVIADV